MRYWQRWVKHCNIPPLYQREVIRSALALKLHCFEDTGAIVAAMTTSIPEAPGSGRTWDYRYCWLRDAYYALGAFRLLGHFEEREQFVQYLLNVAAAAPDLELRRCTASTAARTSRSRSSTDWPGFGGDGPVRVGNGAASHTQHDIFGEMVLALTPIFLDERFSAERSPATLELLERLARKAIAVAGHARRRHLGVPHRVEAADLLEPDVLGRGRPDGAASPRSTRPASAREFRAPRPRIRDEIVAQAWNAELGAFAGTYGGTDLDASLLQMASLRLLAGRRPPPDGHDRRDPHGALAGTAGSSATGSTTASGSPRSPSSSARSGWSEALAVVGRNAEAKAVMEHVHAALSPLGLLSEDYEAVEPAHVGQLPAGVLARRPDPRGLRGLSGMGGRAVTSRAHLRWSDQRSSGGVSMVVATTMKTAAA